MDFGLVAMSEPVLPLEIGVERQDAFIFPCEILSTCQHDFNDSDCFQFRSHTAQRGSRNLEGYLLKLYSILVIFVENKGPHLCIGVYPVLPYTMTMDSSNPSYFIRA